MLDYLSCIVVSVCFLLAVVDLLFIVLACLLVFLSGDLAEEDTLITDVDSDFLGFADC